MRNTLKQITKLALAVFVSLTYTSCGDEESDPKPVAKSDLELVKDALFDSEWVLKSAKVTANGQVFNYVGGSCDFSLFSTLGSQANLTATNVTDFKFSFTKSVVNFDETCGAILNSNSYIITENTNSYILEFLIGSTKYIFSGSKESLLSEAEIKVSRLNLVGLATGSELTFTKTK